MIGMVLVTHGDLAKEFVSALQHVVGEQENVEAVCIGPDDDMEQRRADILASVEKVDSGKGVVLLTDMFGGLRPIWRFPSWNRQMSKLSQGLIYLC